MSVSSVAHLCADGPGASSGACSCLEGNQLQQGESTWEGHCPVLVTLVSHVVRSSQIIAI